MKKKRQPADIRFLLVGAVNSLSILKAWHPRDSFKRILPRLLRIESYGPKFSFSESKRGHRLFHFITFLLRPADACEINDMPAGVYILLFERDVPMKVNPALVWPFLESELCLVDLLCYIFKKGKRRKVHQADEG